MTGFFIAFCFSRSYNLEMTITINPFKFPRYSGVADNISINNIKPYKFSEEMLKMNITPNTQNTIINQISAAFTSDHALTVDTDLTLENMSLLENSTILIIENSTLYYTHNVIKYYISLHIDSTDIKMVEIYYRSIKIIYKDSLHPNFYFFGNDFSDKNTWYKFYNSILLKIEDFVGKPLSEITDAIEYYPV